MQRRPYLSAEDHDSPLPPSSPDIIQPSSPLTMLDDSQGHPLTMCTSSPLSSPPESPALHSLILPIHFPAQMPVQNVRDSEDSFIPSSSIRDHNNLRQKAQKWWDEEQEACARQDWEDEEKRHTVIFKECLSILAINKLTFAELTEFVLFHDHQNANEQHNNFLVDKNLMTHMLNLFASSKVNKICWRAVKDWAESTVLQAINKEVNAATWSGDLWIADREIDSVFASTLSYDELKATVQQHCPMFLRLLVNVIMTGRQVGSASKERLAAKEHVRILVVSWWRYQNLLQLTIGCCIYHYQLARYT